jgi:hypothetical protein
MQSRSGSLSPFWLPTDRQDVAEIKAQLQYLHEQADDIRIQVDWIRAALLKRDIIADVGDTIVGSQPTPTAPGPLTRLNPTEKSMPGTTATLPPIVSTGTYLVPISETNDATGAPVLFSPETPSMPYLVIPEPQQSPRCRPRFRLVIPWPMARSPSVASPAS